MAEAYASQLKVALRRAGKSQAWLAQALGVTTAAVSQWVNGNSKVPQARRDEIAGLLLVEEEIDRSDLAALYARNRTPMAFLLTVDLPDQLMSERQSKVVLSGQEKLERQLAAWAGYLGTSQERLLRVADNQHQLLLTLEQVGLVFDTGIGLTALYQHVGVVLEEQDQVARWLEQAAPFKDWADLKARLYEVDRDAAAVAPLSAKAGTLKLVGLWEERGGTLPTPADDIYEDWRDQ